MAVNVISLSLTAAGTVADILPLGALLREVTFYDQEKVEARSGLDFAQNATTAIAEGGTRLFNGVPFFRSAVLNASAEQTGKLCDFPIENGAVISDHKVREPRRVSCMLVMPVMFAGQVIDQLNEYYHYSKKIIIELPTGVYKNMILESMPVSMNPEDVSRPKFELKFREVLIIEPNYDPGKSTENGADGDTKKTTALSDTIRNIPGVGETLNYLGSF